MTILKGKTQGPGSLKNPPLLGGTGSCLASLQLTWVIWNGYLTGSSPFFVGIAKRFCPTNYTCPEEWGSGE